MPRNFEGRYELMFPVEDAAAKEAILRELRAQLRDDVNAYELLADGAERSRWGGSHDCQRFDGRHGPRVLPAADGTEPAPAHREEPPSPAPGSAAG